MSSPIKSLPSPLVGSARNPAGPLRGSTTKKHANKVEGFAPTDENDGNICDIMEEYDYCADARDDFVLVSGEDAGVAGEKVADSHNHEVRVWSRLAGIVERMTEISLQIVRQSCTIVPAIRWSIFQIDKS